MSLIVSLLALGTLGRRAQALDAAAIYKKALPSVMTIHATLPDGERIGTGFLAFKDGLAVTCWHVVKGATAVTAKFSDGEEFDVSGVVDKDEKRDLALIRVKVADRPLLSFGKGDPEIGSKAYAIGAPLGLEFSISDGIVSQIRSENGVKLYQFSSPVSKGNSGGPLLNAEGELIGVVCLQATEGQNLNFAMPVSYVKGFDLTLKTTPWRDVKMDRKDDTGGPSNSAKLEGQIVEALKDSQRFAIAFHLNTEELTRIHYRSLETTFIENAYALATKGQDIYREPTAGQLEKARGDILFFLSDMMKAVSQLRDCASYRPLIGDSDPALIHYHELCKTFVALYRTVSIDSLKEIIDEPSLEGIKKGLSPALLTKLFGKPDQKGWLPKNEVIARGRFQGGWTTLSRLVFDVDSTGYVFGFIADPDDPAKLYEVPGATPPSDWGFQKNDVVVRVADKPVSSIEEMKIELIRIGKKTTDVFVKRGTKEVKIRVNPSGLLKD